MGRCRKLEIDSRVKVCTGDLRHSIILHTRDLSAPTDVDFGVKLSNATTVKAAIEIKQGVVDVDGTNIRKVVTTIFYVRASSALDKAYMIEFDGIYYTIDNVMPTDGYKRFYKIETQERGTTTKEVNLI